MISDGRKHPKITIAITAKSTDPTSGIFVMEGKIIINKAIAIAIGFLRKTGKSSSTWSKTSKSLLDCKPLIESKGAWISNTSPARRIH